MPGGGHRFALTLILVLGLMGVVALGGCVARPRPLTVAALLSDAERAEGDRIRVAGVVVAVMHSEESDSMFYLADALDSGARVKVHFHGGRPPVGSEPSVEPTAGQWVGRHVVIGGSFDGTVFESDDLLVTSEANSAVSTSQPVTP